MKLFLESIRVVLWLIMIFLIVATVASVVILEIKKNKNEDGTKKIKIEIEL